MIFQEVNQDLFAVPQGYMIAHCISADFALGAGVAKVIDEKFNMKQMLHNLWRSGSGMEGDWSFPCCLPVANVFNLVTKERCFHKPTLQNLRVAVEEMKAYAVEMGVMKIAIPQIGCGLDRLNWDDVSAMIQEIFDDTDIEILVCYLFDEGE